MPGARFPRDPAFAAAKVDRYCMPAIRPTVDLKIADLGDDSILYGDLALIKGCDSSALRERNKNAIPLPHLRQGYGVFAPVCRKAAEHPGKACQKTALLLNE